MTKILFRFLFAFALLVSAATLVRADNSDAVKARMAQRISQIDAMKSRGVVGENNRGLLEAREGAESGDKALVAAENKDREQAYTYLAEKNGTTYEMVARARGRQIVQSSVSGVWVQDSSGTWRKK